MWRSRTTPRGRSMEYTITETDTLERVAASHDCTVGELMKLNKMASRMVFPGQKILVPLATSDDVFDPPSSASSLKSSGNQISGIENAEDGIRKGPGGAVPAHVRRGSFTKTQSAPVPRGSNEEADTDCLQRFLKIKVKQVTESDGTVSGTLLVTPNCLMFDPDVSHPLVKEKGPDLYGMVANMDEIVSVSVYKEIGGLTGDTAEKKRDIFDPDHLRTPEESPKKQAQNTEEIEIPKNEEVIFDAGSVDSNHSPKFGSDIALPAISEETKDSPNEEAKGQETRNRAATLGDEDVQMRARSRSRTSSQASSNDERPRSFSELDTPEGRNIGRFSPTVARRSFGKLGRTLSARAKSIQGTVTSGAEKVVGTAVQGTKSMAHGVVTHTKSAADTLQSGIENGVKVVGTQAKAAADVAGRVVDKGQSLMSESINGVSEIFSVPDFETQPQKSQMTMKREQSLAKLQDLRRQTAEARETSAKENRASVFACATSSDEMPDLFAAVDEIMERSRMQSNESMSSQPILPFYMAVRLTRNKKKKKSSSSSPSYDEDIAFGNKLKREFWFAVPRNQADNIYHFLLQWSPDKYGLDTTTSSLNEETSAVMINDGQEKGFIVLGSNADESLSDIQTAVPFRRRANTTASRPRPDYFANNNNNNDEKQKNSNAFLTEFDVKQMMARSRAGTICVSSMRPSVDERAAAEQSILETVRQADADDQEPTSSGMEKKGSISSRKSTGSHDSGVGTHSSSPVASSLHLSADEVLIPSRKVTVSLSEDTKNVEERKKRNIKRAIIKKVFKKKSNKYPESRARSKSLGAGVLNGEKSAPLFGSSLLNREWELVTVSEMCRRLSLDQELELPIPEGANTSQILDELMIRQVMDILPPRAEGYPWVNIYNSEKHGFSLSTMYRKMAEFDEDLSPVLLIIRDTKEHVFGAVVSSAIRPSDHFFGTGDSCLLWRFTGEVPHTRELRQYTWTGDNQFFVNAAKDSLSIGAGSGRYGLWFDADLNHGRSQKCETFDNEPLCGDNEDFIIQFIEAYGFRM
ncbi:unnamed protein product [Caenorhabditis sp. 36 PRJEB53466]|nr:unnamed protein product [Caenorhabditis sp. 36 PRJEB53466]